MRENAVVFYVNPKREESPKQNNPEETGEEGHACPLRDQQSHQKSNDGNAPPGQELSGQKTQYRRK